MAVEPELVRSRVDPVWADTVSRLLACTNPQELLTLLQDTATAVTGSPAAAVYVRQDDGRLRLATSTGYPERFLTRQLSTAADVPVVEAVRTGRPAWRAETGHRDPRDAPGSGGPTGVAALPLMVDERALGALSVRLRRPGPPTAAEERTLALLASVAAQRLDHLLTRGHRGLPVGVPGLDLAVRMIESRTRAARLELAMSSAGVGAFDWDFGSGRIFWDEHLCRMFGVEPADFDERIEVFYRAIHPDDRGLVEQAVRESKKTGHYAAAYRIVRPDGEMRWIEARGRVLTDPAGRPQGMVGIAQDSTRERRREERRNARREFVLKVTSAFSTALSTQDVVDTMTGTVLPGLEARALAVHFEEDGDMVLAGAEGYPPEIHEQMSRRRTAGEDRLVRAVLESRGPMFFENREQFEGAFPEVVGRTSAGHHAWALFPLRTAEGTIGTCMIAYAEPRAFTDDDLMIYTAVAGILAQSLARARLFDQRRSQMTDLQRVMLPRHLPELPGVEVAVRYLPGAEELDVGGDWYDVLALPGGRVALMIGDVQGHSAQAAAVMGQLRTALLAYADDGHGPGELMGCGNRMLCGLDTDLFATCCIAELDPATGELRLARAGHPYPMVLEADGSVRELAVPGGMPLACEFDEANVYPETTDTLPPGATLLFYTDGLVESRVQDYTAAVAELARSLETWAAEENGGADDRPGLDALADRIAAPAVARAAQDDIAVLLVRRTAAPQP